MYSYRTVSAHVGAGLLIVASLSLTVVLGGHVAAAAPGVDSHWSWCNTETAADAPSVLWARIESATDLHGDIPSTYWSNVTYRDDIAKIACYESTFAYHEVTDGSYGWFQLSPSLVTGEGVTFSEYWGGSARRAAGWYQCTAGERYIHARYGTPVAAWDHEETYGWY